MVSFPHCYRSPVSRRIIQSLIKFKGINNRFLSCSLKKFTGRLWYICSETAALAFFDSKVSIAAKIKMVDALKNTDDLDEISLANICSMKY